MEIKLKNSERNDKRNSKGKRECKDAKEEVYGHWLYSIPGFGRTTIMKLLEVFHSERRIYELSGKEREEYLSINQQEAFMKWKKEYSPMLMWSRLEESGISFVTIHSKEYPKRLQKLEDKPYGLYVKGRLPEDEIPAVAVIGARSCSGYGEWLAKEFGSMLAREHVQIISGMARGIDGISQRAALEAGGVSFAVLGCGVDICYPKQNQNVYDELLKNGGILSEYLPGTMPKSNLFPPRNRIISGLSDIVLVVEAKEKSGTLITVDMALEQGRDVFAIPGRVTDRLSDGCNYLLKQGAGIALSPKDLMDELFEQIQGREGKISQKEKDEKRKEYMLSERENKVYGVLDFQPKTIEQIRMEIQEIYDIPELSELLMELWMKDFAKMEAGNRYVRKGAECL